ncbi:MAG: nuclear transport factor 2 family protein [Acidobacteria bacterium]|nr:nuclear transport factor 2 family protein [Acidobacteriota bacterium]
MTKRSTLLVMVLAVSLSLAVASCAARSNALGSDIEDVRTVELNLREALSSEGGNDALEFYLADDYVHTNYRGVVRTKRNIVDDLEAQSVTREYLDLDDIRVRVYGDVAIVTARAVTRRNESGVESTADYRQMRVFRREQGRWRAFLMQTTLVAD